MASRPSGPHRGLRFAGLAAAPRELGYLGLIVLGALAVRALGVGRGLPYIHEYDENQVLSPVIGMLQRGDLNPLIFVYPSVYYYLLLPVMHIHYLYLHALGQLASPQEIQVFHPQAIGAVYQWYINYPSFYLWGHALTALVGAATVFLVYRLGAAAYGRAVGLLAAAFLAVAPGAVYFSDTVRVDIPMVFFATAAMLAGLRVLQRGERIDYVLSGILAGLAVSTKLNAAVVCLPLAIAHLMNRRRARALDPNVLLLGLCVLAGFAAGTPYILITPERTYAWLSAQAFAYGVVPDMSHVTRALRMYLAYLVVPGQGTEWYIIPHAGIGLLPGIAAAVGLVAGFAGPRRVHLYLASFPLLYLAYMAGQRLLVLRSVMPVLPFAALFSAVGSVWVWERLEPRLSVWPAWRRALAAAGIAILLAGPAGASFALGREMRRPDTRTAAVGWLARNVPSGSRVALEEDLRWFLPDLRRLPLATLFAPRDAALGWYLQRRVAYAVVGGRSPLYRHEAAIVLHRPSYIRAPAADWPQDGYDVVDPDVFIVRIALPVGGTPDALFPEPVVAGPRGVFSETTHLPDQRFAPGTYTLTVTGARPWRWANPLYHLDVRVRVGARTVGTATVPGDRPLHFMTPRFSIDRAGTLPVQIEIVVRPAGRAADGGWALRPTHAGCAVVGESSSLNPPRLTVEAWVYPERIPTYPRAPWRGEPIFSAPIASTNPHAGGFILGLSATGPETVWVDFAVAGHLERAGFTAVRTWTHVAATADGTVAKIYLNGVPAPRDPNLRPTYRRSAAGPGTPLVIGCLDPRMPARPLFGGLITLVRVWNRPLAPEEIRDEAGLGRLPDDRPGLVGSWSFQAASGRVVADRSSAHNDILNGQSLLLVPIGTGTSVLPAWTSGGLDLIQDVALTKAAP